MEGIEFFNSFIMILAYVYVGVIFIICTGLLFVSSSSPISTAKRPFVTVVIAARNEERDLPECIEALEKLSYPPEKLKVILVNDASSDRTGEIIEEACSRNEHFMGLNTLDAPSTHLKAKARGIAYGAKHAEGEWIFITDADAIVPPGWIDHMLGKTTEKSGMIGGMLTVKDSSVVALFEGASWSYTLPFAFGLAGYGGAFICVGPNMAIRKSIYDEAGGLEASEFDVAEDLALFRMVRDSEYKTESYMSPETTVKLNPVDSFGHLFSQQRRWLKGGFEGSWEYWIGLVFAFGGHNLISLGIIAGLFISWEITLGVFLMKSGADLLLLIMEKIKIREKRMLRYFPVFELNVIFTMAWLPLSLLISPNIQWKGKDYAEKYSSGE